MSIPAAVALILIGSFIIFRIWRLIVLFRRGEILSEDERLEKWASENEVKIVSNEKRFFLRGPFFIQPRGRGGAVFRVKAVDREMKSKDAWVRLSYDFSGKQCTEHHWGEPKNGLTGLFP